MNRTKNETNISYHKWIFKEHPYEVGLNGVVKTNNEKNKLVVGLWKHLKTMRWHSATNKKNNCLFEINEEMKTAFAERIGENLDHW